MKFTVSWLKEHLETDASVEEITTAMTRIGLEVEEVVNPAELYAPFKVAHVIEAKPHPDADKLRVCQVDTGEGVLEVVCGAPNARTGLKGIFAPVGTQPPNVDFVLKKAKIRGVESNGMLCSEREMGLSDAHDGIIDLPEDTPIGTPFTEAMGLDDPVIDFEVTPNRPDWNGVDGIARDLAASGLGTLKTSMPKPVEGTYDCPQAIELTFDKETASACPRFAGRYVKGVKNGPSPQWLQKRLKAVGLRPINALVDITNFLSLDRARPLHVYDADKLVGPIRARMGKASEKFLALDGNEYEVTPEQCVIADDAQVLGLGGVMGGETSGCTEDTVNVFIECALFDPIRIAKTGRATGIVSDARYRFERGVDPEFVIPGLELATQMVLDFCGGEASHILDVDVTSHEAQTQDMPIGLVKKLTGMEIAEDEMVRILDVLGFQPVRQGDVIHTTVPSWRPDIEGKADLVEEISHIYGFDHLPLTPLPRMEVVAKPILTERQKQARWGRRAAAVRGLSEAVTYSFTDQPYAELFGGGAVALRLANPISSELGTMRPSILPNLLAALQRNVDRGFEDVALFEVGPQYKGAEPDGQELAITGLRRSQGTRHWQGKTRAPDTFTVKADALAILTEMGVQTGSVQVTADAPSWYHPGRSGTIRLGPKFPMATFGELHPRVLKAMDVKGPVFAFEVVLDNLPPSRKKAAKARGALATSDFQAVGRDFAFVMDANVTSDVISRAVLGADKRLITEMAIFDVFEGASIGEGKKSVAFSITLQPTDKTLTDKEIDAVAQKVIA
ncbi:MAG: phenylalanine--tRNA ligase subunit beta, partial [Alphaproteobacteria bacterium]